jgi:class 3 adenylate cyclase
MKLENELVLRVSPEALWPLVSDTERLNREIGLPPVTYQHSPLPRGGVQTKAATSKFALRLGWVEYPFEWSSPFFYNVERRFDSGPIRRFLGGVEMAAEGDDSRIRIWSELEPKNFLAAPFVKRAARKSMEETAQVFRHFESYLLKREPWAYGRRLNTSVNEGLLAYGQDKLAEQGFSGPAVEKFIRHLKSAPEEEVRLIKPYALADFWGEDRRLVLEIFLEATRAGLVELRWTVLCPSCLGAKHDTNGLHSVRREASCESCSLSYVNEFDKTVEARFDVHPAIRAPGRQKYCMGGPGNTPHLSAQFRVAPRANRTAHVRLAPGKFRIRALRGGYAEISVDRSHPPRKELKLRIEPEAVLCDAAELAPGDVTLAIQSLLSDEALLQVQFDDWDSRSVSAAEITTIQRFRDLFADEAIEPGQEMSIGRLAFLFSDLEGSTALYEQVGDVPAFSLIRNHFKFMKERIQKNRGAIVKTMGDSVMAVFADPRDALRAALDVQRDARADQERTGAETKFKVKIGLHAGPCVVVGTNGIVDYFGSTVNLAQRTQAAAQSGDVMICESLFDEIRAGEIMDGRWESRKENLMLRGFPRPISLLRCHERVSGPS